MESQEYQAFTETVLIEDVDRLKHALLNEYFSEKERSRIADRPSRTIAGLIAAKRAVRHAIGHPELSWHGITISHDKNGKPFVEPVLSLHHDNTCNYLLSITHSRRAARALAIPFQGEYR
jgi:phosphopantetheinyl transferase (holo-ACP synthase)